MNAIKKIKAPRNRTLNVDAKECNELKKHLSYVDKDLLIRDIVDRTFNADLFASIDHFPKNSIDLIIIDPPYNLDKNFNGLKFNKLNDNDYYNYLESWFPKVVKLLKSNGSLYICGDWKCSSPLYQIVSKYLIVRNRITWQREKG